MSNHTRSIIEDLLPLYHEGLLSEETTKWFEEQVSQNEEYQKLVDRTGEPLLKEEIEPTIEHEKMMKSIHRKLALYQIIFVGLSFFLAIRTSLLNDSFGFILWYAVLGVLTYMFYKDMKIVFYISFIPIFIWSFGSNIIDFTSGMITDTSFAEFILSSIPGSIFLSVIHYVFALIGSIIGLLILKLKERG